MPVVLAPTRSLTKIESANDVDFKSFKNIDETNEESK